MCLAKSRKFGDAKIFHFTVIDWYRALRVGWVTRNQVHYAITLVALWEILFYDTCGKGRHKPDCGYVLSHKGIYCSLLRFLVVIGPDHVKQKYFLEIIIRSDKIYNLSGQVKKVARVSKQYILYYLSTCNKDANGQHDLHLCCSHRL